MNALWLAEQLTRLSRKAVDLLVDARVRDLEQTVQKQRITQDRHVAQLLEDVRLRQAVAQELYLPERFLFVSTTLDERLAMLRERPSSINNPTPSIYFHRYQQLLQEAVKIRMLHGGAASVQERWCFDGQFPTVRQIKHFRTWDDGRPNGKLPAGDIADLTVLIGQLSDQNTKQGAQLLRLSRTVRSLQKRNNGKLEGADR